MRIYSNPAYGAVFLELEVPSRRSVRLSLLNALGQPVGAPATFELAAGFNRVRWTLPLTRRVSGVYFLRLRSEGQETLRPLVLVGNR